MISGGSGSAREGRRAVCGGLSLEQDKVLVLVTCLCRCLVSDYFLLTVTFPLTKRETGYGGGGAEGQWDWKGPGNG